MTDTTPDFGPIEPFTLEQIRKAEGRRQVVGGDDDPRIPQSRGWWRERNRSYAEKNIPRRYAMATTDMAEIHKWVLAVVSDPDAAPSLLLAGPTGTGKTHIGYAALRLAAEAVRPAAWKAASSAALLGDLRPSAKNDSETLMRQYCSDPLLFLDDLGAGKSSEWTEEVLYRVIDHRYVNMLPCLFATNLKPGELAAALGDRTASRLAEMCRVVVVGGEDRRRFQADAPQQQEIEGGER